jgi:hypothetical protein
LKILDNSSWQCNDCKIKKISVIYKSQNMKILLLILVMFETLKNEKDNNSKDLYSRKDRNLVLSGLARFYATTEQKLIHSFCNALRIRRKINQLHQSVCYTSSIYYTTQNNPWICRYRFNGNFFWIFFCITPRTRKIKKSTRVSYI